MSGWPTRWKVPPTVGAQAISKCWDVVPDLKPKITPWPVNASAPSIILVANPRPRGWAVDQEPNEAPLLVRYSRPEGVWYVTMNRPEGSRTMSGDAAFEAMIRGDVQCIRSALDEMATLKRT